MLIVLVGGWVALAEASGRHRDTVTVVGEPTTTTTVPGTARLVVDGPAKQAVSVTAGAHVEVTFSIRNAGGGAAALRAFATAVTGFTVRDDCAGGPLAAGDRCSLTAAFDPPRPGTYLLAIDVLEQTTAQRLRLNLTGQAVVAPPMAWPVR